jgi:hypothetical protein
VANRFYGQVERLYVSGATDVVCNIRLADVTPEDASLPLDGYFFLESDHPNASAQYSLALLAASGRHRLQIRTKAEAVATSRAAILYMVIDW